MGYIGSRGLLDSEQRETLAREGKIGFLLVVSEANFKGFMTRTLFRN